MVFSAIDFENDGREEFQYVALVRSSNEPWFISTIVVPMNGSIALRRSPSSLYFEHADNILSLSPEFVGIDGLNRPPLVGYKALHEFIGGPWIFETPIYKDSPGERLSGYLGFRFPVDGEMHHAWAKFTRPDARPETLFDLVAYDWNPVPNAPIGAGLPPEIPISSEWLPEGGGLRLSWPPAIASWILEWTSSLTAPVVWELYPSSGSYADVPPADADHFFRLRRP